MHPCRDDDPGPVDLKRSLPPFLKNTVNWRLSLTADVPAVGDGEQMDLSTFAGAAEHFLVEIYFLVFAVLEGEGADQILAFFVGIGIGEGKLHPIFLLEGKAEGQLRLICRVILNIPIFTYIFTSCLTFSKGR